MTELARMHSGRVHTNSFGGRHCLRLVYLVRGKNVRPPILPPGHTRFLYTKPAHTYPHTAYTYVPTYTHSAHPMHTCPCHSHPHTIYTEHTLQPHTPQPPTHDIYSTLTTSPLTR